MRKSYYLLLANYLYMAGVGLLSPIYALFILHIHGDAFMAGFSWSVYLIVAGLVMMAVGGHQDSSSHIKKYIMFGYGLAAVSTFAYLIVDNFPQLIALQIVHAFGIGLLTPALRTAYTRVQDKKRQGHEWALFDGGIFILQGIAALTGGILLSLFDFTALFIFMGTIQLLSLVVIYKLKID